MCLHNCLLHKSLNLTITIMVLFMSRLSMIVRVNVVLNRTVVVDSDGRFHDLCGSTLRSHAFLRFFFRPWDVSLQVCVRWEPGVVLTSLTDLRSECCQLYHNKCRQFNSHSKKAAVIHVSLQLTLRFALWTALPSSLYPKPSIERPPPPL